MGRFHVSAADTISDLEVTDHGLSVTLRAPDAGGTMLLHGPALRTIRHSTVDGTPVPEVTDLDAVASGQRVLPQRDTRLVKPGRSGRMRVACVW